MYWEDRAHTPNITSHLTYLARPKAPLHRRVGRPRKSWTFENMKKAWQILQLSLLVTQIYRIPLLIRQTVQSEKGLLMLRKATTLLLISLLNNPLLFSFYAGSNVLCVTCSVWKTLCELSDFAPLCKHSMWIFFRFFSLYVNPVFSSTSTTISSISLFPACLKCM